MEHGHARGPPEPGRSRSSRARRSASRAANGDIVPELPHGVFFHDTRLVSRWTLLIDGDPVEPLSSSTPRPYRSVTVGRAGHIPGRADTPLIVERDRRVDGGLREEITLRSYSREPMALRVELVLESDFADIFEVKEGRAHRATAARTRGIARGDPGRFAARRAPRTRGHGARRRIRRRPTGVRRDPRAARLMVARDPAGADHAAGRVLDRSGFRCRCVVRPCATLPRLAVPHPRALARGRRDRAGHPAEPARPRLPAHLRPVASRSRRRRCRRTVVHGPVRTRLAAHRVDVAAGRPHARPRHAAHPRRTAGHSSGCRVRGAARPHPPRGAARRHDQPRPRRRLGVLRHGGCHAALRRRARRARALGRRCPTMPTTSSRRPIGRSSGSSDTATATATASWSTSGSTSTGSSTRAGRTRGTASPSPTVPSPARPSRSARCRATCTPHSSPAPRSRTCRGDDGRAAEWHERAANLKREFNERFWLPDRGYFALALDADKRPVDSCASNMGHCLWTGIIDDDKAGPVAERLLSDQLFTGWGVRTLASDMGAYNPASYHNGSVWPHDNAIVAAGLMRYGFVEEANRIVFGMFEAATRFERPTPRAVLRIRARPVSRAGLVSGVVLTAGLGRRDAVLPAPHHPSLRALGADRRRLARAHLVGGLRRHPPAQCAVRRRPDLRGRRTPGRIGRRPPGRPHPAPDATPCPG